MFGRREFTVISRIAASPRSQVTTHRLASRATASAPTTVTSVQNGRQTASSLHWLTVVLALAASLIFVLTDADGGRSSRSLWIQIAIEIAAAVGFTWLVRRRVSAMNEAPMITPLLLTIVLASLLWEPFQRWFLLAGRPFEMMVMHSQKNLMLAAAVFGCWASYQRLSILIGVALAIFLAAICREHRIQWLIAIYGFAVVSWMIASHWDTLRSRLIAGETRRFPLRWLIIGSSIPLLMLLASANGSQSVITAMRGFLPGSGGDGASDPYSRGGVNDGENLVAGTDNIKSFGPIEDAPFAEDDKPSLYDVFNDSFDEPVRRIKDQDRSIALPPELLAEIKARMAKSEQAGKEFSTLRRSTKPDQKKIKDLESHALLYVAGRVPLHLRMETYDLFDGIDWIAEKKTGEPSGMAIVPTNGRPWLRVPCGSRSLGLYAGSETHAMKVINLRSNVIPAPLDLRALHIDKVDRADMFGWHSDTILKMERKSLPELTSIHLQSECMDQSLLRGHEELTFLALSDKKRTQLPEMRQMDDVQSLAQEWTRGIPQGYRQIEAICQQLRSNYTLDRSARVPEDSAFPVGHFLFESKRGAEYQFATAATLLLRSLGFSTRLVSGFYASPERYDARKRHTAVHSSDVHFWCEVYVGAGTWVTLEPTPGYEVLSPPPGVWKRAILLASDCVHWMFRHWLLALTTFTGSALALVRRRWLSDQAHTLMWRFAPARSDRGRILQTVRLLDHRLRLARLPRPAGTTFSTWLRRQRASTETSSACCEFLPLADWAAYGADNLTIAVSPDDIENCCCRISRSCTLAQLQKTTIKRQRKSLVLSTPLKPEVAYS